MHLKVNNQHDHFVPFCWASQGQAVGSTELNSTKEEFHSSIWRQSLRSDCSHLNHGSATLQLCGHQPTAYSLWALASSSVKWIEPVLWIELIYRETRSIYIRSFYAFLCCVSQPTCIILCIYSEGVELLGVLRLEQWLICRRYSRSVLLPARRVRWKKKGARKWLKWQEKLNPASLGLHKSGGDSV